MRIMAIAPTTTTEWNELVLNTMKEVASSETEIEVFNLEDGPLNIESVYQEELAVPCILELIKEAQNKYDGVIICCFAGPGLDAAKEISSIPVIGVGEAAQLMALPLGDRYGIVTTIDSTVTLQNRKAKILGTERKLVSVRPLNLPVLELEQEDLVKDKIFKLVKEMISEDKIDVLVLGCGLFTTIGREIQEKLRIPTIIPHHAAIKLIEAYVKMGLAQSEISFMNPLDD